jgi:hypothetical protein
VVLGSGLLSACEKLRTPAAIAIRSQEVAAVGKPVPVRVGVVDTLGQAVDLSLSSDVRQYQWSLNPSTGASLTMELPWQMSFVAREPGIWVISAVTTSGLLKEWETETGLPIEGGPLRGEQTISVDVPFSPQSLLIETTIENYDLSGHSCPGSVSLTFVLADDPEAEQPAFARRATIQGLCLKPEVTAFEAQGTFDQRSFDLEGGQHEHFSGTLDGGVVTITGGPGDQTFTFQVRR